MIAETGEVVLEAAAGGGDDDAISSGEFIEKRPAAAGAVEDGQRPLDRFEPGCELPGRHVGAAEVKLRRLAIERAVADEDEPDRLGGFFPGQRLESLPQLLAIGLLAGRFKADGGEICGRLFGGCFPAGNPLVEL